MLLQNCGILKYFYLCHFLDEATIIFAEKKTMKEQFRQQIETARQRLIKQRRLSRMKDFKKFREHVYDLAKRRFGEISLEVDQRLNLEFEAIRVNRRTLMINTVALILRELDADGVFCERTQQNGYNVSLVCYLLGISLFNPMEHPELITERFVRNTFENISHISFCVNTNIKARLEEILDTHGLKEECSTEKSFLKRIGDLCIDSYVVNYDIEDADNSSFEIRITYTERLRLDRKMRKLLGIERYESIPLGDSQTMESLYNLDLYGTSYSLDMITYESIRKIKPRTISELTEALAFWHDRQYPLLVDYLTNKSSQATVYTGDTVIDEILGHTHGILLYTRQQEAYMKRLNELSCADPNAYDHCNAYLQRQLKHAKLRNKCSEYVKALNLYRSAYIKVHYPDVFKEIIQ